MMCRNQPLQGHVRAIAIFFMCLTGISLFCLVLKLAKSNRHDPLKHFMGTGRNDIIGGIVLLTVKMITCGILYAATENRKKLYLYPFMIWHCLEIFGCLVLIFYGGYLLFTDYDSTKWKVSVYILSALSVAILDSWFMFTVVSFYKELSKEPHETQGMYPVDVELHTKSYGDIYNEQSLNNDRCNRGYGQFDSQPIANTAQPYHQSDRRHQTNAKGYEDVYGQQGQYNENANTYYHNQPTNVTQQSQMMYETPQVPGYSGPAPKLYTSPYYNY